MTDTEKELMYVKRRLNEACCERDKYLEGLAILTPKIKQYKLMSEELEEKLQKEKNL